MDSAGKLAPDSGNSVPDNIKPFTRSEDLNDGDGRCMEKSAQSVLIDEKVERVSNRPSFYASNNVEIKTVILTNQIYTIIDTDNEVFNQQLINDSASLFVQNDFLSNIEISFKTAQWRMTESRIKTLITKFDNTKHNMVYFSNCLVCMFRKMTERSLIPQNELNFKLIVFIDAISKFVKDFNDALWEKWVSSKSTFIDWIFFLASVFMPKDSYVSIQEESIINNATKYFKRVRYGRYLLFNYIFIKKSVPKVTNVSSTNEEKTKKRKFEENVYTEVEKTVKRIRVTGEKNNVINE